MSSGASSAESIMARERERKTEREEENRNYPRWQETARYAVESELDLQDEAATVAVDTDLREATYRGLPICVTTRRLTLLGALLEL